MPKAKQRGLGKGLNSIFGQDVEQYLDDIQNNAAEAPGRREVELPIEVRLYTRETCGKSRKIP